MVEAAAREGYAAVTVAQVIALAGVSRPTFYEYFTDKNDCFVAALDLVQGRVIAWAAQALEDADPTRAAHDIVIALVGFAADQPTAARVLFDEAMAGGPRALDVRDDGIRALEQLVENRYDTAGSRSAPDLSPRILVGGMYRLLAARLRREELDAAVVLPELLDWIDSYTLPLPLHRWRHLEPIPVTVPATVVEAPLRAPDPVGSGHRRLSRSEVAENHRQRLLLAAATLAETKGYAATSVADIARVAGVDQRVFYRVFADKEAAFGALHELLFRHIMAVTATGFIAGESWPERVWEAGRAFASYVEQNPTLAHASFVDSHAGGTSMVQRVEQLVCGFTIFLQEGYQYTSRRKPPSSVIDVIVRSIFELDYVQVRESRLDQLSGLMPHVTFIAVAPFIGATTANELIEGMVGTSDGSPSAAHFAVPEVSAR